MARQRSGGRSGAGWVRWCIVAVALVGSGCGTAGRAIDPGPWAPKAAARQMSGPTATAPPTSTANRPIALPPVHGRFSYQIGGSYPPPAGVSIVDRDHTAAADPRAFSICYVNAYQAQTDARAWWIRNHPDLILRNPTGHLIIDRQWDEPLFDISSSSRRSELIQIVGDWIDGCAARGYQAVEADNLDSYTRSEGRLSADDALAFGRLLAIRTHRDHLSLGQKNGADLSVRARAAGFDFAIAEECQVYTECGAYTQVYGARLIEVEYTDPAFVAACRQRGHTVSVVRRDRDVTPPSDPHHIEHWCP